MKVITGTQVKTTLCHHSLGASTRRVGRRDSDVFKAFKVYRQRFPTTVTSVFTFIDKGNQLTNENLLALFRYIRNIHVIS